MTTKTKLQVAVSQVSPPIDRALSIAEPFAWCCCTFKNIENRTWQTSFRGRIAIHASRSLVHLEDERNEAYLYDAHPLLAAAIDHPQFADVALDGEPQLFRLGAIIGSVELVDCIEFDPATDDPDEVFARFASSHAAPEMPFGYWAEGPFCWVLAHPKRYRRPIECRGAQSLWRLSPEQIAAVAAAEIDILSDPSEPSEPPKPLKSAAAGPAAPPKKTTAAERRKRQALTGQALPAAAGKRR